MRLTDPDAWGLLRWPSVSAGRGRRDIPIECDHGRLKARLRPMRGLKRDRTAQVIIAGHAFMQNLRRGHYELGVEEEPHLRTAGAFDELSRMI